MNFHCGGLPDQGLEIKSDIKGLKIQQGWFNLPIEDHEGVMSEPIEKIESLITKHPKLPHKIRRSLLGLEKLEEGFEPPCFVRKVVGNNTIIQFPYLRSSQPIIGIRIAMVNHIDSNGDPINYFFGNDGDLWDSSQTHQYVHFAHLTANAISFYLENNS